MGEIQLNNPQGIVAGDTVQWQVNSWRTSVTSRILTRVTAEGVVTRLDKVCVVTMEDGSKKSIPLRELTKKGAA